MSVIRIQTEDNVILEVAEKTARSSCTLKSMIDNFGIDDRIHKVPPVKARIAQKVFEFCEHHELDETSNIERNDVEKSLTDWNKNYFDVDQQTLFDLILAANYFDIKMLFRMGCYHVAKQVEGKSTEELRIHFNLPNDLIDDKTVAVPEQPKQSVDSDILTGKQSKRKRGSDKKSAAKN